MIGPYDNIAPLPILDLYDANIMQQAIAQAKNMYDVARQDMKDFKKEYGDFLSPIQKDMDWYNKNVTGKVKEAINDLYSSGIDPLRSAEGRAAVSRVINNVDTGMISKMRQSAETKKLYNAAAIKMGPKYNKNFSDWYFARKNGGINPDDWSTEQNGVFSDPTPMEFASLQDLTYNSYKGRTPRTLTKQDFDTDPRLKGYKYDPRYEYTGYIDSDLMKVAPGASASLAGDPRAEYFRNVAEQKVIAQGQAPTKENIEAQFQRDIADANSWALVDPIRQADEYAKMQRQYSYNLALQNKKHKDTMDEIAAKNNVNHRYSATTNMVVDSEGTFQGQLAHYADKESIGVLDSEESSLNNELQRMLKDPKKYSEKEIKDVFARIENSGNRRISVGLEGVANEVLKLADKTTSTYFTNRPEDINTMLRDLSSVASSNTVYNLLSHFGTKTSDGGVILSSRKDRLCGVGEVMDDVLSRGYADGVKHPSIDRALEQLRSGALSKYRTSWTAGSFDIRNETDDAGWYTSGQSEFWPTGNVLTGGKYYYIEVSNDPSDNDECCWFKVERDIKNGGGINPVLSSITQDVDDQFMKTYSNSNVIGNQQSAVSEYNK